MIWTKLLIEWDCCRVNKRIRAQFPVKQKMSLRISFYTKQEYLRELNIEKIAFEMWSTSSKVILHFKRLHIKGKERSDRKKKVQKKENFKWDEQRG